MESRIIKTNGNIAIAWGRLPPGVYKTQNSVVLITRSSCEVPEQAFLADFDVSQFAMCFSYGITIHGQVNVGEGLTKAEEMCGNVGCGHAPVDTELLFSHRHVAVIGGTGSGKSTLIMRSVEHYNDDADVVILAYHPDLLELSQLPHVEVVRPRVNVCDLDYQSLFMMLQFHRLSAEPVKMQRYLRMLLPIACDASKELGIPPHETLLLLLKLLVMLEAIEQRCKAASLVGNNEESLYCQLRQILEDKLGKFKYNVVKDLARSRDAESLNSLLMYAEMALTSESFDAKSHLIGTKPVTVLDITPTLSLIIGQIEGRLASILSTIFAQRLQNNKRPLYVVIDEFTALSSVEYLHQVFKLLLMQGRKFGVYLVAAGQPDPSLYDLLPNFHRVILGRIAGSRAIRELATGLPNVPAEILQTLPTLKPLHMIAVDATSIMPFKTLHPSWRHAV